MSFVEVTKMSELPVGTMKGVTVENKAILVANINGSYYAIAGKCTHAGGDLSKGKLEGSVVTCPRHGSKFDVTTGNRISGPARQNEARYEVKIEGNSIEVNF